MGTPAPRILVADDQADILQALRLLLKQEGFAVDTATSPAGVLAALERDEFDALLMDLNYTRDTTSGREGLDVLARIRQLDGSLPVVVMTAFGSVEGAVEAMRHGARDYLEKPWDNTRLVALLHTQVELGRALRRTQRLEGENQALRGEGIPDLVTESPAMRAAAKLMSRVAPSDANVLLLGEHGVGKEVAARWLHTASTRAGRPMITVNVGGLSEGVFESELFGHLKGAFTDAKADRIGRFELADRGTLFLDEIANITQAQQAKLLRVLNTGEFERVGSSRTRTVSTRVFSATNADLRAEVAGGRFREDLLYRLNTVEIRLPALRERREDIPHLAAHFLATHAAHYRKPVAGFQPEAMAAVLAYGWPGNIRELDHAIERAVLLADGAQLGVTDLALTSAGSAGVQLDQMTLDEVERVLIQKAMARSGNNVTEAARSLGLSRSAMYRRLERFGL
ncbi:MAG TPA: sigma-54 dependent transcriptional regulator [Gemmatimonadales bacterium]|nr:sigma-54 dependent transcriptional regulator [Gemmatimonadales bacterium]